MKSNIEAVTIIDKLIDKNHKIVWTLIGIQAIMLIFSLATSIGIFTIVCIALAVPVILLNQKTTYYIGMRDTIKYGGGDGE